MDRSGCEHVWGRRTSPLLHCLGLVGCWGSHSIRVRDRARGFSLPAQKRVEDSLESPKWSSAARP